MSSVVDLPGLGGARSVGVAIIPKWGQYRHWLSLPRAMTHDGGILYRSIKRRGQFIKDP
jgi:hypothetical protein